MIISRVLLLIIPLMFSCGLSPETNQDDIFSVDYGNKFIRIETLGHYSVLDVSQLLQLAGLQAPTETTCGFYLYRITYKTKNFNGDSIPVSGLVAIPDIKNIKGIVSWQHGTNASRNSAPSSPTPDEGIPLAAFFAGDGYILLAPDYIGLGVSKEIPTYLHTQSTVNTVVDLIKIGANILQFLSDGSERNLYLVGFSQGGSATAGVQRSIEENNSTGLTLKGSACIAGAFNLREISLKYAIENNSVFYLAYIANAYAHVYGEPLGTILNAKYVELIRSLFDGGQSYDDIHNALPPLASDLYRTEVIDDIKYGRNDWFTIALDSNETYRWIPHTDLRLYYGTADKDVSPEDAIKAAQYMTNKGGNVSLISVGPYDHGGSLLSALPYIQQWFNSYE